MTDSSTAIISVLNENDVLLGRGKGRANYVGNKRFRALAQVRKQDYRLCDDNGLKTSIAHEIYEVVDKRGGRFLQLINDGNAPRDVLKTGKWRVASFKASIQKCKQALREKDDVDNTASEDGRAYKKRPNSKNQGPLAKRQKAGNQVPRQTKYLPSLHVPNAITPPMLVANAADGTGSRSVMTQSLEGIQQKILLAQHQAMMQRRVAINGLVKTMHSRASGSSQNVFRNHIPIVGRLVRPPLSALGATCRPTMATPINVMSRIVSRDSPLTVIEKGNALGRLSRPLVAFAPRVRAASSACTLAMNDKPAPASRDKPYITDAEKDAVSGLFTLSVAVGNEPNSNSR